MPLFATTFVAGAPPIVTVLALVKPLPLIWTAVPPAVEPVAGVIPVTDTVVVSTVTKAPVAPSPS